MFQIRKKMSIIILLAWTITGSSLPQMRGTGYAAVVLHSKCPVTKQMR
ncbi:hypothetical protein LCGC14_1751760, partial [marine sediment metagenome]